MNKRSSKKSRTKSPAPDKSKKATLWRIIKRTALVALVAVALIAGTAFFLVRSEPAHWKEHQQFLAETSPKQLEALAAQVEEQLNELANLGLTEKNNGNGSVTSWVQSLAHPDDVSNDEQSDSEQANIKPEDVRVNTEKTISLNNEQLAAVMQLRMDDWMKNRGYVKPNEVKKPMIAVKDGKLVMAFRIKSGPFNAVISGKFNLSILDNGMADLTLSSFLVGQLPVPAEALGEYLRDKSGGDRNAQQAGEWLGKLQHMQIKPVVELKHRRRARVMDYTLHDDGLDLQVRIQDHLTYKSMNSALAGVPTD